MQQKCLNCNHDMYGPVCSECGQKQALPIRANRVIKDIWSQLLELDFKFIRALKDIIIRPDVMINGCNFNNSLQDKLGCQTISSISVDSSSSSILSWEIDSDVSIGDSTVTLKIETGQDQNIFLPRVGLIQFKKSTGSDKASSTEVIRYSALKIIGRDESTNVENSIHD